MVPRRCCDVQTLFTNLSTISTNNLSLNVEKTKEIVVDFSRELTQHAPLTINGATVERVSSTKFLGVYIKEDLSWTNNTPALAKKSQQRLYFLRKLRRTRAPAPIMYTFYRGTMESILTSCITVWYGTCNASCRKTLQRIPAAIREETAEPTGQDQQVEGQLHSSGSQEAELAPELPPFPSSASGTEL
ncbi:hypothetical protein Q8A73_012372 [Channa argus]|nr:hypothetical protein Q8A73_012372 [Channa argus]